MNALSQPGWEQTCGLWIRSTKGGSRRALLPTSQGELDLIQAYAIPAAAHNKHTVIICTTSLAYHVAMGKA